MPGRSSASLAESYRSQSPRSPPSSSSVLVWPPRPSANSIQTEQRQEQGQARPPPGSIAVARTQSTASPVELARRTSSATSNSNSRASATGALSCGGAPEPASERVSDEAMRMLKSMKSGELREICKVATAMEKTKIEEEEREKRIKEEKRKKVASFVAKTEKFVDLVGDCYICLDPLLNNIGTAKFGVLSWHCRCTVPQKAHSACVFSKFCHGQGECDMCHSPMKFEKTTRRGLETTIQFHPDAGRTDDGDVSGSSISATRLSAILWFSWGRGGAIREGGDALGGE